MTEIASPEKASVGETLLAEPVSPAEQSAAAPSPIAYALAATGTLALEACGGASGGSTPTPAPTPAPPPVVPMSSAQASRFLSQAAIGYSRADISSVVASGATGWINNQFSIARPQRFWDFLVANGYNAAANMNTVAGFDPMMWSQLMGSADLLRQRVGMALLDQWVVGIDGFGGSWRAFAMAAYLDILWDNAFGNYRDIMEGVSTNAAMGLFLTFLGNARANTTSGSIPDENYARELMQLFTIGLYNLNMDGTLVLSGGNPVPSYTQADVSQAARVWTGYTYAAGGGATPDRLQLPMIINAATHETGATAFLGISIPAGTDGATARRLVLDGLFNHANVPPFVSKQLIQHLVTSNPSPAYVGRVAAVFANNGSGVRGDMKSVIRAILTDSEARDDSQESSATFGKLREPVVRLVQWAKAFGVTSPTNLWPFGNTSSSANRIAQGPGRAPSVFNWFRPGYTPPGTTIASKGLVAPEFQITSEPSVIAYVNYMQSLIVNGAGEARPDYSSLTTLATDSAALLAELNLLLAANQISAATIAQMKTALDTISIATNAGILNRIQAAIVLVMASPEYLVLR
ncbi:DUF1800 domain-containing protein [Novosphingobium aquae]|uniref:DUF1800 family protein n=1 Tax=Novosphingobium aquae TaxID=3133435 RepID=A0ABU8SDZ4_9SPHN